MRLVVELVAAAADRLDKLRFRRILLDFLPQQIVDMHHYDMGSAPPLTPFPHWCKFIQNHKLSAMTKDMKFTSVRCREETRRLKGFSIRLNFPALRAAAENLSIRCRQRPLFVRASPYSAMELGWYRDAFVPDECVFYFTITVGRSAYFHEAIHLVFEHAARRTG